MRREYYQTLFPSTNYQSFNLQLTLYHNTSTIKFYALTGRVEFYDADE